MDFPLVYAFSFFRIVVLFLFWIYPLYLAKRYLID